VLQAFAVGSIRTEDQDVLYGVRRLADVALKALSPGVNDETTGVTIANQLGAVVEAGCAHALEADGWRRYDLDGVTVLARAFTVRRLVEDAFAGLVRFSADHPRVLARVAEILAEIAARQPDGDARDALVDAGEWVEHAASRAELASHERRLLESRLAQLRAPRVRAADDRPHALH
jgi:uncharacterized membrane protein